MVRAQPWTLVIGGSSPPLCTKNSTKERRIIMKCKHCIYSKDNKCSLKRKVKDCTIFISINTCNLRHCNGCKLRQFCDKE